MNNGPEQRSARLAARFSETFGRAPVLCARAPGRVDLMGSHTDYNLGYVLTMAISRDTWIAARPRADRRVCVRSLDLDSSASFHLSELEPGARGEWSEYMRGVAAALAEEGLELTGFDAVIESTVPIRSGLSSSAALECATAVLFQALGGWALEPPRMAKLCQLAEHRFAGVECGILDQFSSCLGQSGHALLLDCRDLSTRAVAIGKGIGVVICDTRAERELRGSEYGTRRAQCAEGARAMGVAALRDAGLSALQAHASRISADVAKRSRFIIEENDRVLGLAAVLPRGDRDAIAHVCSESFHGAAELYEIACPAMHSMMRAMLGAPGVIGARQAGAGFGGCMVAFVEAAQTDAFAAAVRRTYAAETGIAPEVYPVEPAPGAGLVSLDQGDRENDESTSTGPAGSRRPVRARH